MHLTPADLKKVHDGAYLKYKICTILTLDSVTVHTKHKPSRNDETISH